MNKRYVSLTVLIIGTTLVVGCATSPAEKYTQLSEVPPTSEVDGNFYKFSVVPASSILKNSPWRRFKDNKEPRNTVLLSGIPGFSYSLNVTYVSHGIDSKSLVSYAEEKYKGDKFYASKDNPNCAISDPETPLKLSQYMKAFVAECADPNSKDVFELVISEKSISGDRSSSEMALSMNTFVRSFRFK